MTPMKDKRYYRRPIIAYQIVASTRVQSLTEDVNYWISKGWQPIGGISDHGMHICQVMVCYGEGN
jgi:hypothetical protein